MLKAGLLLLALFIGLALLVQLKKLQSFDEGIAQKIFKTRSKSKTQLMLFFTALGRPRGFIVMIFLLAFVPGFRTSVLLPAGIALGFVWVLAYLLKRLIKRPRPEGQRLVEERDHSFPSYHATCSSTLFCCVALGGSSLYPLQTGLFMAISLVMAGMIGYSRIYLGIHYLSDVLGGWFLGTGFALILQWFLTVNSIL